MAKTPRRHVPKGKTTEEDTKPLPKRITDRDDERRFLIAALLEPREIFMGTLIQNNETEQVEEAKQAAFDLAASALEETKRVTHSALRNKAKTLYGPHHMRIHPDSGISSYSYKFFNTYEGYIPDTEESQVNLQQVYEKSPYNNSDDDKTPQDDDDIEEYDISEPLISGGEEEETEQTDNTTKQAEHTLSEYDKEQQQLRQRLDRTKKKRATNQQAPSFTKDISTFNTKSPTSPTTSPLKQLSDEEEKEEEEEDARLRRSINMATPSPRSTRKSRPPLPTVPTSPTKPPSIIRENEHTQLLKMIKEQEKRLTEQTKQHNELIAQFREQQETNEKFSHAIQIREMEIKDLRAQLKRKTSPKEDIQKELDFYKTDAAELLNHLEHETERQRQAGEEYLTQLESRTNKYVDVLETNRRELKKLIKKATEADANLQRNLDTTGNNVVKAQLHSLELKARQIIATEIQHFVTACETNTDKQAKQIEATGLKVIRDCNKFLDDMDANAITQMDTATFVFEDKRKEIEQTFKEEFKKDLNKIYTDERATFIKACKHTAVEQKKNIEKHLHEEMEKLLKDEDISKPLETFKIHLKQIHTTHHEELKTTMKKHEEKLESEIATYITAIPRTIETHMNSHLNAAQIQMQVNKNEMKDDLEQIRTQLESIGTDIKIRVEKEYKQQTKTAEKRILEAVEAFEEHVKLEKGMVENHVAAEFDLTQSNLAPPRTCKATPTLAGTIFDYTDGSKSNRMKKTTGGHNDPDPDDDPDDDSSNDSSRRSKNSHQDSLDDHSTSQRKAYDAVGRPIKDRRFKAQAAQYVKNLRKFADGYTFSEFGDSTTPMNERTSIKLYRRVHQTMKNLQLPLMKYEELAPNGTCLHPDDAKVIQTLGKDLLHDTAEVLYNKLSDIAESGADKTVQQVIAIYYVSRDGYKAFYELMQRYNPKLQVNPDMWSVPWKPSQTVFEFVGELITVHQHHKDRRKHDHTEDDLKMELILRSQSLPQFQGIATTMLFLIDCYGMKILHQYSFSKLIRFYDTVDRIHKNNNEDISTITDHTYHKVEIERPEICKATRRRTRSHVQCTLCQQYGHSMETDHICYFAGKLYHTLDHLGLLNAPFIHKENLKLHEKNAANYADYNLPETIKTFMALEDGREQMAVDDLNVLFAHKAHLKERNQTETNNEEAEYRYKTWTAEAPLAITHLATSQHNPHFNLPSKRVRFEISTPPDHDHTPKERLPPPFHFEPGLIDLQPMKEEIIAPVPQIYYNRMPLRKERSIEICTKQRHLQGDTGANVSATNDLTLLWNYHSLQQKIPITTYDGTNEGTDCQAIGRGIIKIIANDDSIIDFPAYYIPNSTGTILSPDHYVRSNNDITWFNHYGNEDRKIGGYIAFGDKHGNTLTQIDMARRDGLWFTSNKILLAPTTHSSYQDNTTPRICKFEATQPSSKMKPFLHTWHHPTINSSQAYKDLEIWHQRMGHIDPRTMIETSKVTDGMPKFKTGNTHFSCPYCDKAKIRKQSGKKKTGRTTFLPGTAFHMDLGFIHDTKTTGTGRNATKQRILKDRKGHTAYLLIICAATRYIWVFPLTSKHPPLDIINKFLDRHGQAHGRKTKLITTSPKGALATSTHFDQLIQARGLAIKEQAMELDFDMQPLDSLRYTVRTDNGGELAGSNDFRNIIADHGYNLETTAPGTSSLNGLAERPNKTLKERVRCLLYMAGLGVEFWADALLHAVWLYNRTYHSSIHRTPFEAYTGRRPLMDHLLTFGCRITARKPGARPTALASHCYEGIFLGYSATTGKVVYWDPQTQKEKSALTPNTDEIHYGTPPNNRPPAAKHLIEVITGTPHAELSTHEMKEKAQECIADDDPIQHLLAEHIINNSPLPHTAAAAKVSIPTNETELLNSLDTLDISLNLFEPAISERLPLFGDDDPFMGFRLEQHPSYEDTVIMKGIRPGSIASKEIKNWRSRLRGSIVRMVNDTTIVSPQHFRQLVRELRNTHRHHATKITIQFAHPKWSDMNGEGLPTMAFDQLNVVAHHLSAIKNGWKTSWDDDKDASIWPTIRDEDIISVINKGLALPKLTRRRLKTNKEEWPKFKKSEWVQLDKYEKQNMFGTPIRKPKNATVLPWVWSYVYKTDPVTLESTPKSRGTCNGGKRHGKIVTLAETYAACVEQPAHRLTWALIAALNYVALGTDIGNAFAEAPGPDNTFYMYVDEQFQEWWTEHLKRPPIPKGYVIPIQKNLQGHPEGPRLWDKYISRLMQEELGFKATTHEPCLYYKYNEHGKLIFVLRQVDDFLIAGPKLKDCNIIRNQIATRMANKMNDLGIIKRFNGVDIDQTRNYIKLSCPTYIDKIVEHHGWTKEKCRDFPVPMQSDSQTLSKIQLTQGPDTEIERKQLEQTMGFSYRQAIGELIFAMSTCRVDISSAVIQLSQHAANPAQCHYLAAKQIFVYLYATKDHGLYYWRPKPYEDLPLKQDPKTYTKSNRLDEFSQADTANVLFGSTDATWGNDKHHRRSISGTAILLAGAVIYYRCQLQPTVALSSTEAEFAAMAETGKAALYLRSILNEIGILQQLPTTILADNAGAICLAQAQQPTRRTKHVEIKQFAILQWTEQDLLQFQAIPTEYNTSDSLTKSLGRTKFYEQNECLMGRRRPRYAHELPSVSLCSTPRIFTSFLLDDILDPLPNPIYDPQFGFS